MDIKGLVGTKTFKGGIGAILAAVAGYFSGVMSPGEAIMTGVQGVLAIFVRDGLLKVNNNGN